MLFEPFQPPKPAPDGPATVFPWGREQELLILFSGFGGRKGSNSIG
jgi:hypothetical protein